MVTPELQALVAGLIGFAVTAGIKSLAELFHVDLSGFAAGITAAIVTSVVFFANSFLASLPANLQPIAVAAMPLIVAIFAAFGIHYSLKKLRPVANQ